MAIPDYQTLMLPLLKAVAGVTPRPLSELTEAISVDLKLSDAERSEILPSGAARVIASRLGWARTYLKQAGLVASPKRGFVQITALGTELLASKPTSIDNELLSRYPSFRDFRARSKLRVAGPVPPSDGDDQTPEEAIAGAYQRLRASL